MDPCTYILLQTTITLCQEKPESHLLNKYSSYFKILAEEAFNKKAGE
jgi:hypothetical protein